MDPHTRIKAQALGGWFSIGIPNTYASFLLE